MQDKTSTGENFKDQINDFIQRNRIAIFSVVGILVFLFIGAVIFIAVSDNLYKKSVVKIEELTQKYDELRFYVNDDYFTDDVNSLILELETFAAKTKGFPGSKAWSLAADIYANREDWSKAEEAFINSARTGNKTYLGPLSLFNAAAAAEEQGKLEQAIDLLQQCVSHVFEFPSAPRAQFSIGRLYEQLGNNSEAIAAYREVLINWPEMPVWHQLARSRIIAIEIQ